MHHGVRITDTAIVAAATLSDRYVTARFLPDKAIDLVDEAASRLRMEIDSRPVEVDEVERAVRRLEIEEMALAKEDDPSSVERLAALREDLADRRQELDELTARWQQDKSAIVRIQQIKEELERVRTEAERAERDGDLAHVAELRYGRIPQLEKALTEAEDVGGDRRLDAQGGGRPRRHRRGRPGVDRHPGRPAARGRDPEAAAHGGRARQAGRRPAGRRPRRLRRRPPRALRASPTPTGPPARSSSSARPASARPSWPRRWRSSCSTTSGRWSAST